MKKFLSLAMTILIAFQAISFVMPNALAETDFPRSALPDGPEHTNELVDVINANTTKVLIVTEGWGPLTGVSPIADKDLWTEVLSAMTGDFDVDWFDGIPTTSMLNDYDLLIYDAGGYWYPLSHVTGPLREYHFSGKPMIVVAPDINYDWGMGYLDPSFVIDVLHIEGVLGILPESEYDVYAGTGHSIESGLPTNIHVPDQTSWPDCFDPASDAESALIQKYVITTEFGVGTAADLPQYSLYNPLSYYTVVAYPGASSKGRVVTIGVPVAGLSETTSKQLCSNVISWVLEQLTGRQLLIHELIALNDQIDDALDNQLDLLAELNARIYMELELEGWEEVWDYVKKAVGLISFAYGASEAIEILDDLATNAPKLFDMVAPMVWLGLTIELYDQTLTLIDITEDVTDGLEPSMGFAAVKAAYKNAYYQNIEIDSSVGMNAHMSTLDEAHEDLVTQLASMPEEDPSYVHMRTEVSRIRDEIEESMSKETSIAYIDLTSENLVGAHAIGGLSDFYVQLEKYFEAIDQAKEVNDYGFWLFIGGALLKVGGYAILVPTVGTGAPATVAAEIAGKGMMAVGGGLMTGSSLAEHLTKKEISERVAFKALPLFIDNLEGYGEIYTATLDLIENWDIKGDYSGECTEFELDQYTIGVDPGYYGVFDTDITGNVWLSSDQTTKGRIIVQFFAYNNDKLLSITGNSGDLELGVCTAIPFITHLHDLMWSEEDVKCYRAVAYISIGTKIVGEPLVQQFTVVREGTSSPFSVGSFSSSIGSGEAYSEVIETDAGTDGFYVALDYPGSDLDLHLFDSQGNHIGMDYSTGAIEIQIPNARYSGPDTNPEWISIKDDIGEEVFTMTVVGVYVENQEPFALSFAISTLDSVPPTTSLTIGSPQYTDGLGNIYVTSTTSLTLDAADDGATGSGVAQTSYRVHDSTYDTGWIADVPPISLQLVGVDDGTYYIDYNSTDNAGNVEATNTETVILDNTPPSLTIETPSEGDALQDGVTFRVSAWDLSAVDSVTFSIQRAQGNIISPEFESMPATLSSDGKWELYFDTTQLPDGFYMFVANGTDVLGNTGTTTVQFSIRNWACLELLPASESNKGGRTMPVKFSLRIIEAVDPAQPFVYNEELTIIIYAKGHPENILQESTFGTTARDYRIDTEGELYITNFKTLKKPTTYVVEIWRKGMLIGTFEFSTVK